MTPGQEKFGLTPRELEIVSALAAGCTNKEISETLKLSLNTVKLYLVRIFGKLGVASRLELALLWLAAQAAQTAQKAETKQESL